MRKPTQIDVDHQTTTETKENPRSIQTRNHVIILPILIGRNPQFVIIAVNVDTSNLTAISCVEMETLRMLKVEPTASLRQTKGNYLSQLR